MSKETKPPFEPVEEFEDEEPSGHPILTKAEIEQARATARKRLEAERKKAAMKAVEEEETLRLQVEEGMTVGGPADDMVTIIIDVPRFAACDRVSTGLAINGRPYRHGETHTVPRHVADTLRSMMFMCWQHEQREIRGDRWAEAYRPPHLTHINHGAVLNPPASRG